jgi:hypothetical protein
MTKYEVADKAIQAYEAVVFAAVGRSNEQIETHIIVLGLDAMEACEMAARDRSVPQWSRDHYANECAWFRAQHG